MNAKFSPFRATACFSLIPITFYSPITMGDVSLSGCVQDSLGHGDCERAFFSLVAVYDAGRA